MVTKQSNPAVADGLRLIRFWYWLGALCLAGVAAVSLLPVPNIGANDKLSHLLVYVLLASWFSLLVRRPSSLVAVALGLLGYGVLIELLQSLTTYRQAEWGDLVANGCGILIGVWSYFSPLRWALAWLDDRLKRFFGA